MSSWAKRDITGDGQERVASWLNKVPGYSGYKRKESRRDEDKRVREELAAQYNQHAQRLSDLQGELVRARKLTVIGDVERLERSLRLFTDRLRVATYGYGGLFSDRPVDERALDQLQAFDRSLGDGLDELRGNVEALESAVRSGGDLAEPIRWAQATIDSLSRRFDLRGQVVESGQPQEGPAIDALFAQPAGEQPHVTSDLHFGDAVTIGGTDYLVQGRMEFHSGDSAWRQYLLRDLATERWLHVPPNANEPMALLERVSENPGDAEQVTVGGTRYTRVTAGEATAEVIGEVGAQSGSAARFRRYSGDAGAVLFAYDWGGEWMTLAGRALDPLEVNVYAR